MNRKDIRNVTLESLQSLLEEMSEPKYRLKQLLQWLYGRRVTHFTDMKNVPKSLRDQLENSYTIQKLKVKKLLISSEKSAVKFGFESGIDDYCIESVLLFDGKRKSLCVSSQLGCNLKCTFCATGTIGFIRNLTLYEIIGQLIAANDYLFNNGETTVTNIIFMGMGEALSNYSTFIDSLTLMMHKDCFGIGGRKITVSTAGVVPSIKRLLKNHRHLNINVAISLNSFSDSHRNTIMPINKKYPIRELIAIVDTYYKTVNRPVTFEYVLIEGENDTDEAALSLITLLKKVHCKINLIPLNTGTSSHRNTLTENRLNTFAKKLSASGLTVLVRKSKGQDILGACGQLSGR